MAFQPENYGPVFSSLLSEMRANPLDGGSPNTSVRGELDALTFDSAFPGRKIVDADMAECCVSAAWLYHNFLDDSHTISQGIHSTSGSYWHGIMHRREPDYPNSKSWFRKVGDHEVFDAVAEAARAAASGAPQDAAFLASQTSWDPNAFIDLCGSSLSGASQTDSVCRDIQQREFEILFDYCYREAVGG